ncbi:hypothetical protein ISCGN_025321 [Ixodes scapularis]
MGKEQELLDAARNGNLAVVERILSQRAKKTGPLASLRRGPGTNAHDQSGYTSLHHSALNGHPRSWPSCSTTRRRPTWWTARARRRSTWPPGPATRTWCACCSKGARRWPTPTTPTRPINVLARTRPINVLARARPGPTVKSPSPSQAWAFGSAKSVDLVMLPVRDRSRSGC